MNYFEKLKKAAEFLEKEIKSASLSKPELLVILGSGLGDFAAKLDRKIVIEYKNIPNFPVSTVLGHSGKLILASDKKRGKNFWVMQGRVHFYEGYSMNEVVFPVRLFSLLGVKRMIVTNAAGGVNRLFDAGDLMIIRDHINLMGTNPLIGPNIDELGTRFPDMSCCYSKKLGDKIKEIASDNKIAIKEGIYAALTGPSFETPAEIRMLQILGADAVGMSTVPEVIAARHSGIEVAGISFISNKAAGLSVNELTHEEVTENAKKVEKNFGILVSETVSSFLENLDG